MAGHRLAVALPSGSACAVRLILPHVGTPLAWRYRSIQSTRWRIQQSAAGTQPSHRLAGLPPVAYIVRRPSGACLRHPLSQPAPTYCTTARRRCRPSDAIATAAWHDLSSVTQPHPPQWAVAVHAAHHRRYAPRIYRYRIMPEGVRAGHPSGRACRRSAGWIGDGPGRESWRGGTGRHPGGKRHGGRRREIGDGGYSDGGRMGTTRTGPPGTRRRAGMARREKEGTAGERKRSRPTDSVFAAAHLPAGTEGDPEGYGDELEIQPEALPLEIEQIVFKLVPAGHIVGKDELARGNTPGGRGEEGNYTSR